MENNRKLDKYEKIGLALGYIVGILLNVYFFLGVPGIIILAYFGKIVWWWLATLIPFLAIIHMIYKK